MGPQGWPGVSARGPPQTRGNPLPSRQFSGGASGSWLRAPLSTLPSWVAPPQGSGSPPGTLLLQLLVDRVSVWLTWGLQDSVCGGVSSQVLETAFLEGGSGVSTGSPWSPGLRGAARAAFLRDPGEVVFLEEGGAGIQPSGEREDVGRWAWGGARSSAWLC